MNDRRGRIRAKIDARCIISAGPLETPCKVWTGPNSGEGRGGGYGRMSLDGATVAVHIAVWTNQNGLIPPRKQIDHRCRNRLCCAEDHLEMVTHKTNQKRRDQARTISCEAVSLSV